MRWRKRLMTRFFFFIRDSQRIYIYKEYKAKSPRLQSADIYPRKQEAVRKTTPELLSAVLRSLLCGVCVYFTTSILCTLYSRVGRFCTFWILCKAMLFAAPLGELPFFNFGSKTSECYTFKGPYFQKQIQGAKRKNRFFGENVFFTVLPILY